MDVICLKCDNCETKEIGSYTTKFCKVQSIKLTGTRMKGINSCEHFVEKNIKEKEEIKEEQDAIVCKECDDYLPSMNACCNEVTMKKAMRFMTSQIVPDPSSRPDWCPRKIK